MNGMIGKLIIRGDILIMSGLHIGAGNSSIEIGGIDSSVIKNHKGIPYIPGSSLKGKLRSLSELAYGKVSVDSEGKALPCNCGKCEICKIYGTSANTSTNIADEEILPTRIIVRDAFLKDEIEEKMRNRDGEYKNLEFNYTESKWENSIDRLNSVANPRVIERVPAGTIFEFEVIYTIYNTEDIENIRYLKEAFQFLQDDYLGGNGTRGYGKVEFNNVTVSMKTLKEYKNTIVAEIKSLDEIPNNYIKKLKDKFELQ